MTRNTMQASCPRLVTCVWISLTVLIPTATVTMPAGVAAESGTFFCSEANHYGTIWESDDAKHIIVTVTVTSDFATDLGMGTTVSRMVVESTNEKIVLYNGQTGTIEDDAAYRVEISESPAVIVTPDHYTNLYGMGGTWELTVVGGGGNGGGGHGGSTGDSGTLLIEIAGIAVIIVIAVITAIMMVRRKAAAISGQYPTGQTLQGRYALPQDQQGPAPSSELQFIESGAPPPLQESTPFASFCPRCGAPVSGTVRFCEKCGSSIM